MKRNNALTILRKIKPVLAQQFGVTQMALFDSTARDEACKNSDEDYWSDLMGLPPRGALFWRAILSRRPVRLSGRPGSRKSIAH